jgi:hypothetical protein
MGSQANFTGVNAPYAWFSATSFLKFLSKFINIRKAVEGSEARDVRPNPPACFG